MAADDPERLEGLVEEVTERCRRGESPSVGEYAARYPDEAERIRELLPPVLLLENLRRRKVHARSSAEPEPVPAALGDFRILREVGRGGMGVVYEAEHVALRRRVALKVLPRHSRLDPKRLERFRREAQAAARLHHTNIVPVLGLGEADGLLFYVMQFIEGRDLRAVVEQWKEAPTGRNRDHWAAIARIGLQAAEALQYAHDQGILHRDIKPANLLLDHHGVVWVTDFGLAKLRESDDLTHSGDIVGTLQYMAPEQLEGRADARTDVYGLGLTLFELLTLRPGFDDSDVSRLGRLVSEGQPPPPRRLNPAIPQDLETIVLKAIAREPERRYPAVGALAEDLRRYLDDRPIQARRASAAERLWRWCRRNRPVAALSVTAAASLLLAATLGWIGYANTRRALAEESRRRDEAQSATKRADANVALALKAFETLFNKVATRDDDPPRPGFGGPLPGDGPPPGPGGFDRPPPPGAPPRPATGPVASRRASQAEVELLEGILEFYDQFAAKNATNTRLQREAAKAYRRSGDLSLRLGRAAQADVGYRRAAELLEALLSQKSAPPGYRYDLAEIDLAITASVADPLAEERRLRRALALGEALALDLPDEPAPLELIAHANLGLGQVLAARGRPAEAEPRFRRALATLETVGEHRPAPPHVGHDRLEAGMHLARFLHANARSDEARALLHREIDAFQDFAAEHPRARRSESLFDELRDELRRLGEPDSALDGLEPEGERPPPPEELGAGGPPPPLHVPPR